MRCTGVIFLLFSFFHSALGYSINDLVNSVDGLTTSSTCSSCTSQDVPSAMTIVDSNGLSIDIKFNSTLKLAFEKITSAYVTNFYKSSSSVTGLGCSTEYQYVEKTQYSWTIYFTLHLEYESSTTISATQIAQTAFSSLETYNSYLSQLNLNLTSKQVVCASTAFPTKAPVVAPTLAPTKAPVTKKPVTNKPVTEKPVTAAPTKKPTKKPVATASPIAVSSVTDKPIKLTPSPTKQKVTSAPTETEKVVVPSSMTIVSNFTLSFDAEFIAKWEKTTSEYYTYYYQNSTKDYSAVCYAKYLSYEIVSEVKYVIQYVLYVDVQYTSSYTYSSTEVTNIAQNTFSSQTTRVEYSVFFSSETGYVVQCKNVQYSSSSPTKAPVTASSPTSSPVVKSLVTSTVEGSMNFTTSLAYKIEFSSQVINAIEKATSMYITRYYAYNENVQDLTVTAEFQGSKVLYECGCTTIVYFSFDVSYSSSTYTASEIIVQPFNSRLSRLAYTKLLTKAGFEVELEGTSLDDTYSKSSTSSVNTMTSLAVKLNSGLLTYAAGAIASFIVLVA
jgi:hypothetical protein